MLYQEKKKIYAWLQLLGFRGNACAQVHHVDVQPSPKDTMPLGTRVLFGPGCVILWLLRSRCKTGRGARTRFQLPLQDFRALPMQHETKQTFRSHQWLGT